MSAAWDPTELRGRRDEGERPDQTHSFADPGRQIRFRKNWFEATGELVGGYLHKTGDII